MIKDSNSVTEYRRTLGSVGLTYINTNGISFLHVPVKFSSTGKFEPESTTTRETKLQDELSLLSQQAGQNQEMSH